MMMEPGGYSQGGSKPPTSSSSTTTSTPPIFTHPSPPPSAHGFVDHRLHIWGLPPPRQQQGEPPSIPAAAPPPITLPPISSFENLTPPNTAFTFGQSNLPLHIRSDSDQTSISTLITAADPGELAKDDDDGFEDTKFVYENGRRYHANVEGRIKYPLPNDESEQEREDMNHNLALLIMRDKLFYAPIEGTLQEHGGTVFDLGKLTLLLHWVPPLLPTHRLISPLRHTLRT